MPIKSIWRYPVKGFRGEPLTSTKVLPVMEVPGDRASAYLTQKASRRRP